MNTNVIKTIYRNLTNKSWHLGFISNGLDGVFNSSPIQIQWVANPYKDRWFADPFILDVTDSDIILLAEEYRYSSPIARIAMLTIDKSTMVIVNMEIIIDTGSHLSFPNILREKDKIYIYPENANAGHQDIYEYNPTTHTATFLKTICYDCIWDATITDLFGKRLMFTANKSDYFLDIYEWDESQSLFIHKQQLESKMKNSRMAGQFFTYNGEIYAPFQNCERTYGGNIDLKKVTCENGQFSFETVRQLFSTHPKFNEGLHTLNEYKGVVVIDVIGYNYLFGKLLSKTIKHIKTLCKRH